MRRLFLLVIVITGCADTGPEPTTATPAADPQPPIAASTAEQPAIAEPTENVVEQPAARPADPPPLPQVESAEDRRLREFREEVSVYLDEARAGAKLLTLGPSLSQVREKSEQMTELYIHLPDVPASIPERETVEARLKNINGSFAVAQVLTQLLLEAVSLDSAKLVEEGRESIEKTVGGLIAYCDEVESHVGDVK